MSGPAIVIPARYASTRYPGKPLAELRGADGVAKSLVRRSWEAAMAVDGIASVHVATDDDRIADHVRDFGGEVIMTPAECRNGTERCAAALDAFDDEPEIVVNLQGDAPLTPAWFVEELVAALRQRSDVDMATPVLRADHDHWTALVEDRRAGRVGGTTAVFDATGRALYFSKEVIPFLAPDAASAMTQLPVFHHVGVYAYRPDTLRAYGQWPVGPLESQEGLEQLRFLEQGRAVLCVETDARGRTFWELNNPEDIEKIEAALHAP
ncbi:3-deoxy-manno-octulosonate cytidylyltransferase [Sphingomicrobium clamense]|uniref:3-deoxy-manno-octulosonate cytidylyltransferase n=1 Tax=Sphingomicrobium clamense TaxID=2851013 RepID=A0ABS6V430_9SPHN|nr:3-deoxy-manno-octulosonate cytidylyltransferase [Sphingomicrobium sp. B8]